MNKIYKAKLAAAKNCYKYGGEVKKYEKGGAVAAFKPCKGCKTPAKCKKAGKCLKK